MSSSGAAQEAGELLAELEKGIPRHWDGKQSILELRQADFQWRQMEWIGWYFEYKARKTLEARFGRREVPTYGRTRFDFRHANVWDFKAHPTGGSNWAIINDKEAVDLCIRDNGGLGIVLAVGPAQYDSDGSFKAWHDQLKGGTSEYERERIRRAARSRSRKTSFDLACYIFAWLTRRTVDQGLQSGWIKTFQDGMRNADGSPRRAKYMVDVEALPESAVALRKC
ncbi:MAG TPA: hypothetical protein VLX56_09185 [Nitrososphaerales archaeon]|nr:hypothetical protein [Nitrososphaerales archaeon]